MPSLSTDAASRCDCLPTLLSPDADIAIANAKKAANRLVEISTGSATGSVSGVDLIPFAANLTSMTNMRYLAYASVMGANLAALLDETALNWHIEGDLIKAVFGSSQPSCTLNVNVTADPAYGKWEGAGERSSRNHPPRGPRALQPSAAQLCVHCHPPSSDLNQQPPTPTSPQALPSAAWSSTT